MLFRRHEPEVDAVHFGDAVLDRLERADLLAESLTGHGIIARDVEQRLCGANLLVRGDHGHSGEHIER